MTPDQLRDWRRSHGYTQATLAGQLGVDIMTVNRWEVGTRSIPPFLWLALRGLESLIERCA